VGQCRERPGTESADRDRERSGEGYSYRDAVGRKERVVKERVR